jgi:hypothetical protein
MSGKVRRKVGRTHCGKMCGKLCGKVCGGDCREVSGKFGRKACG